MNFTHFSLTSLGLILLWLSFSLLHNHCCIEMMEIDIYCISCLRYAKLTVTREKEVCPPVMLFCPLHCHSPDTQSVSLESSALIPKKQGSHFLQFYLFDDSLMNVTPAQGKGQNHMIWDFSFDGK